ncbi:MAG: methyltransferase domain-containing protein [Hyphomicrobiaceae bacterium]|nr:methyltransferase domain-containing protein [Hyphomicrobiaceae bacterium]
MSSSPPELFDRTLLRQRRERVVNDLAGVDFLLQRAALELDERLDMVLRDFPVAVDLGAGSVCLSEKLAARQDVGKLIVADQSALLLKELKNHTKLICDEENLPFAAQSLNLVTSLLSLHFVNDLPGALIQIRQALKADGLFMAAVPGGRTLIELRSAFMQAEEEISGGVSPRVAPMADVKEYGSLLQRAGFTLPVVDSDLVNVTYDNPLKLMHELRFMGAGNVLTDRLRKPLSKELLGRVLEIYQQNFSEDGRINATFEIIYLSGWSPHSSQQQPLAPGSAQTSLSAALGTCPLPEDNEV